MDFPGRPVAKTPCSQCKGPGFDPWLGNYIPRAATKNLHVATKKKKKKKILYAATKTHPALPNK